EKVKISQHQAGYIFKSGSEGVVGIITNHQVDTFTFSLSGYNNENLIINSSDYITIKMKLAPASAISVRRDKLASLTKNLEKDEQKTWFTGDETYASIIENRFINAKKFPN